MSDCEELSGGYSQEMMNRCFIFCLFSYSNESLDVPEFLEVLAVHVVPSEEVRMVSDSNPCFLMVPELPTATKVLFP